jgi:hypothetical protein
VIFIEMGNDDGFKPPSPRGNLVGQFFALVHPKLTIYQDGLAFSADQTSGDADD